jgi:hypothetical protein
MKKTFKSALVLSALLTMHHPVSAFASNGSPSLPKVIPTGFYTNDKGDGTALSIVAKSGIFEADWYELADFSGPILLDVDGNFNVKVTYIKSTDPCQTQSVSCTPTKVDLSGRLTETDSTVTINLDLAHKHYVLQAPREPDTKVFSGEASTVGTVPLNCDVLTPPSPTDAEADANQQASDYCSTLLLKPVRVSGFTYSTNYCVWGGAQYHYPSDRLHAEAQYQCK